MGFDAGRWGEVSGSVMYRACLGKFSQNADLCQQLIATAPKILVEANPTVLPLSPPLNSEMGLLKDSTWGIHPPRRSPTRPLRLHLGGT